MSREQLDFLVTTGTTGAMSGVAGEGDHPTTMQEGAKSANINMTASETALSKLDNTADKTHTESKNEQGSGEEGNNSSVGSANSEDSQQQHDAPAAAHSLPLQDVDEESHAAAHVEEQRETTVDSSLPTPTDDDDDHKVKGKTDLGEEEEDAT
jgi:hypothetical protein